MITVRKRVLAVALVALSLHATGAAAQISRSAGAALPWAARWDVAYDSVHQIYLLLADGKPPTREQVRGQFIDAHGNAIGGMFSITSEVGNTNEAPSWATVTFGGTSTDPAFLVTYLVPGTVNEKYGRIVRYRQGVPQVSDRVLIYPNVGNEWFAADRARPAWNGEQFIVPTRVPGAAVGAPFAQPLFTFFSLSGVSSGGANLGNGTDYEGGPSVACNPGASVCMAIGFAAGLPFGGTGGIWARLFNGRTLQPITDVFYTDDHSTFMDTPHAVFNVATNQFNVAWYRRAGPGAIDFRSVATSGAMGPLDLSRSFTIFPGEPALSYNPITQTSLLVTKWGGSADLYTIELGADGYPRDLSNPVLITLWDGSVLEYRPSIAANQHAGQWLVTYNLGASSGFAFIGAGGAPPPPPPPPPPPAPTQPDTRLAIDKPFRDAVIAGGTLTITGWALDVNAPVPSPGVDAVHVWAFPAGGGQQVFLGVASFTYRPDVGDYFQQRRFDNAGFTLTRSLPPGVWDIAVFAHSVVSNSFTAATSVRVRVSNPHMSVDEPRQGFSTGYPGTFRISGWAGDLSAPSGSGVNAVHVWAYPVLAGGNHDEPRWVGSATLGGTRHDVATAYNTPNMMTSGFTLDAFLWPGTYDLVVWSHSTLSGFSNYQVVRIYISPW